MDAVHPARFARFGPFQLDLRAAELRRKGIKVRLPDQSVKVLAVLVENAGEIVTRDELHHKLWPNGTIVEFDRSINAAIKRLRQALEDSADEPQFIETVPRRGYRFLAPVECDRSKEPDVTATPGISPATVSHYRIIRELARGGMGVVYQAEDVNLGRLVAVKFLPDEMTEDQQALERFRREARAASALNHPNICTIYEIGDKAGRPFIAMELLEGEDLSRAISGVPIGVNRLLDIALQTATALNAAHRAAITHRDIKPANIFLTRSGHVKLLDFGVAKPASSHVREPAPGQRAGRGLTTPGEHVGTPGYMSPEQARGKEADARSDIYSFGLVLYEMATGQPWRPGSPFRLHRCLDSIIRKALENEPEQRFQSAAEIHSALLRAQKKVESRSRRRWMAGAASAALVAIGSGLVWMRHGRTPDQEPAPQVVPLPASFGDVSGPAFSPDGTLLAYSWTRPGEDHSDIYVQQVGTAAPLRITTGPQSHFRPSFSPDGRHIAHFHDEKLMLIPTFGGPERKITDLDCGECGGLSLEYTPDGKSVVLCERVNGVESIVQVTMDTGERHRLTTPPPGEKDFVFKVSPDGRKTALIRGRSQFFTNIYVKPADGSEIVRVSNESGLNNGLAWTADSSELVFSSGSPDNASLKRVVVPGGVAQPVTGASIGAADPAISRLNHRLAYASVTNRASTWRLQLSQPRDRASSLVKLLSSARNDLQAQYSPDERKVAFQSTRSGGVEIWVANADGTEPTQLTNFDGPIAATPHWSPDGRRITFDAWARGSADVWVVNADGGSLRRLTTNPATDYMPHWSSDGTWIYFSSDRTGKFEVWKVDPATGRELQMTRKGGSHAMESPDGRYLYFAKELADGHAEIWKMSVNGGNEDLAMVSSEGKPIPVQSWYNWQVFDDGIYFLRLIGGSRPTYQIEFFDFQTIRSKLIEILPTDFMPSREGLRVSTDRRWVLFSRIDLNDTNVMLINNFR